MINITDKHFCCGCSACVQSCPKQCITLSEDREGFQYPVVDTSACIDCKLCEKVCPYLKKAEERKPLKIEAAYNSDIQTRLNSSSGGLFFLLAEYIIKNGGVVFGARFDDNWNVIHDYTDCVDHLPAFRGSKYVQSRIGNAYQDVKRFLDYGRLVLFTGTPCQVMALKNFLRKNYDNLYTVDIVCHGVPSPRVWRDYLDYLNPEKKVIISVNMRDKSRSWSRYSYKIESDKGMLYDDYAANSEYLRMYISGFSVRPSCFNCPAKGGRSHSDITLADAWGIKQVYPDCNDEKGTSAVCINFEAGKALYDSITKNSQPFPLDVFYTENPSFDTSAKEPELRGTFWKQYEKEGISTYYSIKKIMKSPLYKRLLHKALRIFKSDNNK